VWGVPAVAVVVQAGGGGGEREVAEGQAVEEQALGADEVLVGIGDGGGVVFEGRLGALNSSTAYCNIGLSRRCD